MSAKRWACRRWESRSEESPKQHVTMWSQAGCAHAASEGAAIMQSPPNRLLLTTFASRPVRSGSLHNARQHSGQCRPTKAAKTPTLLEELDHIEASVEEVATQCSVAGHLPSQQTHHPDVFLWWLCHIDPNCVHTNVSANFRIQASKRDSIEMQIKPCTCHCLSRRGSGGESCYIWVWGSYWFFSFVGLPYSLTYTKKLPCEFCPLLRQAPAISKVTVSWDVSLVTNLDRCM